jgi:FAD/FMN-containing dehydrogenase
MNSRGVVVERLIERVRDARDAKTALDIRGGDTKRFYGHAPRGDAFDVRELSGITSYEPTELVVTALGGTPLKELEEVLAERGQCMPFEPPRFGSLGTVGGMVAAGLAGPARASVGPLRDFVLGVSLLDGKGEMLTFGGQVMKNVAGYDVSRLMAGSMGVLGVICEVSLKVMPSMPACRTLYFDVDEAGALNRLNRWAGQSIPVNASSWHRGRLSVRLAGAKAAIGCARERLGGQDRLSGQDLFSGQGCWDAQDIEAQTAASWWADLRDHRHPFFVIAQSDLERGECLWRLSVPDTAPPLSLPGEQFIEWGGAQRWWRSTAPAALIRSTAAAVGGHATLVRP